MTPNAMFGPYRLESLLGRGGMGEVHLAFDTEHHRTVALKTLAPHLADDEEFQSRFRREARHVAKLRNPHVIPIHRYGEIDGRLFIDMRYVEGPDLGDLVRSDGALPPRRAVAFVEQVASALDAAHGSGLVHRDVKPSNVLVDATVAEFVYLVDFGITRPATTQRSHSLTRTGALLGSLDYMAPEQFDGAVSPQSDVYGLTCVLFELLTGVKPYQGDGLAALMHSHMSTPPPAPSARNPELGPFDDVIATGMAKQSEQRYATAGELAASARAALGSGNGHVGPVVRVPAAAVPVTASDEVPPTVVPTTAGGAEPEEPDESADASGHDESDRSDEPKPTEPSSPRPRVPTPAGAVPTPGGNPAFRPDSSRTDPIALRPRPGGPPPPRRDEPRGRPVAGGPPAAPPPPYPRAASRAEPPSGPGDARVTRATRLALALAALALVAVAVVGLLAFNSGQEAAEPTAQPAGPPTASPPGPSAEADSPPAVRQTTFTGRTDDDVALTIVVGNNAAMAYLCDGSSIEAWLRGEILPDNVVLLENPRTGSRLEARLDSTGAVGVFSDGDTTREFSATASGGDTGLYEAAAVIDGQENRIGWVVLGDGTREGIRMQGDDLLPAPPLDVDQLTTAIDGETIPVTRHNGDGTFVGG